MVMKAAELLRPQPRSHQVSLLSDFVGQTITWPAQIQREEKYVASLLQKHIAQVSWDAQFATISCEDSMN